MYNYNYVFFYEGLTKISNFFYLIHTAAIANYIIYYWVEYL